MTADTPHTPTTEFIDSKQVETFSTLSLKTLQRRQKEGHDTGLRKHGRRIVFHLETLRKFLNSTCVTR